MDDLLGYIESESSKEAREKILRSFGMLLEEVAQLSIVVQIECINSMLQQLHSKGPFNTEPVNCLQWVKVDRVEANDYNPNKVAPPEMRLLEHSIREDGFTQPIVVWEREYGVLEVVDGFHRNRIGRESKDIVARLKGYMPVVIINKSRVGRNDRIAATIRHNRARGKHQITSMSDIVVELKRRNWSDKKIGHELGMDPDEVLRLSQISGLAEMFADKEFTEAWEADTTVIDDNDTLDVEGEHNED